MNILMMTIAFALLELENHEIAQMKTNIKLFEHVVIWHFVYY